MKFPVTYGQYYLTSEEVLGAQAEEGDDSVDDGFVTANAEAMRFSAGTHTGDIDLEVRVLDAAPTEVDANWDVVVQRSFSTVDGARQIWDWDDAVHTEFPTIPEGGSFCLRAHARGRMAAALQEGDEQHLLLVWPAAPSADIIHKMDEFGTANEDTGAEETEPVSRYPSPPSYRAESPSQAPRGR